jgi:hypothetical protein
MKKIIGYVLIVLMPLIIQSCSAPVVVIPNDVLSQEKMVEVLTDIHLAESAITLKFTNKDTSKLQAKVFYDFVYKAHKTTKEQFSKSYDFYVAHPELLNKIYDDVLIELSKKQAEVNKKN